MQRGYSEAVAVEAVKLLIDSGYIDDLRASRKVLAARSGKKQESKQFIYQRLLEAGIDEECADLVVDDLESDIYTCKALFEANFGSPDEDSPDREDEFLKIAVLRGYSMETARKAFRLYLEQ